jgi:pimeloyl-ACP methyl ester carboxylesterase
VPVPVVLVHALGGSAADWAAVRTALAAAGHEVTAPDLPAHGTRAAEPFRFGTAVAAVTDAADSLSDAAPPLVVGRALGGHLAIAAAASGLGARAIVAAGVGTEVLGWVLDSYRIADGATALLPDRGAAVDAWAGDSVLDRGSARAEGSRILGPALDDLARFAVLDAIRRADAPVIVLNGSKDRFRFQEGSLRRAGARVDRLRGERLAERIADPAAFVRELERIVP